LLEDDQHHALTGLRDIAMLIEASLHASYHALSALVVAESIFVAELASVAQGHRPPIPHFLIDDLAESSGECRVQPTIRIPLYH